MRMASATAPCRRRCSTMCSPGGAPCPSMKPEALIITMVVCSARSISGRASLSDRAAGRLEFQASMILRPSEVSGSTAGTNDTAAQSRTGGARQTYILRRRDPPAGRGRECRDRHSARAGERWPMRRRRRNAARRRRRARAPAIPALFATGPPQLAARLRCCVQDRACPGRTRARVPPICGDPIGRGSILVQTMPSGGSHAGRRDRRRGASARIVFRRIDVDQEILERHRGFTRDR